MKIDVVIGANAGDEGKGTITARLASASAKEGKKIVNILKNGGAQRGHSVALSDGNQYIFKHYGSGTPFGATTYCDELFIVNPMQLLEEHEALKYIFYPPKIVINPLCKMTTPFDIMANLIIETDAKKGSCGMGIWETILRYKSFPSMTIGQFWNVPHDVKIQHLKDIRDYFDRSRPLRSCKAFNEFAESWNSDNLIERFAFDVLQMFSSFDGIAEFNSQIPQADHLIVEYGQGLLLCDKGVDDADTTPSFTGYMGGALTNPNWKDITLHYVTRPYITRHGAKGRDFLGKEKVENIGIDFTFNWETNKENANQGAFEYGKLDIESLAKRIKKDSYSMSRYQPKVILEVTHNDQMQREKEFKDNFKNVNFWDSPVVE